MPSSTAPVRNSTLKCLEEQEYRWRKGFISRLLVRGDRWFWAEPGCVLEHALRASVVEELLAADEALLHRHLAPGAEAIGEVG
jgi:hypothetical protein